MTSIWAEVVVMAAAVQVWAEGMAQGQVGEVPAGAMGMVLAGILARVVPRAGAGIAAAGV
ncbi:hypothetical protein [Rhodospirillum sp. A1_3_36]|uniref:hypothetical protein n=1 Tax=Rhodospirillum sp. A1_3_36 TaxID=3391666 RepID=UPI0039A6F89E